MVWVNLGLSLISRGSPQLAQRPDKLLLEGELVFKSLDTLKFITQINRYTSTVAVVKNELTLML